MAAASKGFIRPTTTPTPDEVFDVWLSQLTGSELKVLLYIVRRTFGFKKEADAISLSQICSGITTRDGRVLDRGTGLARNTATKAVKKLESLGLILVERTQDEQGSYEVNSYRLRFRGFAASEGDDSDTGDDSPPEGDRGGSKTEPGVGRKSNQGSKKNEPPLVRKTHPQQTASQETALHQTGSGSPTTRLPRPTAPSDPAQQAGSGKDTPSGAGGSSLPSPQANPSGVPSPATESDDQAIRCLVAYGVWRSRAVELVDSLALTTQSVTDACQALDREMAKGAAIANPPAVLASRLAAGWAPAIPKRESETEIDEIGVFDEPHSERRPLPPIVDARGEEQDAYRWFEQLRDELRLQVPREVYNALLRFAELAEHTPAEGNRPEVLAIELPTLRAREWVQHRLHRSIRRQVGHMLGREIELVYVTEADQQDDRVKAPALDANG